VADRQPGVGAEAGAAAEDKRRAEAAGWRRLPMRSHQLPAIHTSRKTLPLPANHNLDKTASFLLILTTLHPYDSTLGPAAEQVALVPVPRSGGSRSTTRPLFDTRNPTRKRIKNDAGAPGQKPAPIRCSIPRIPNLSLAAHIAGDAYEIVPARRLRGRIGPPVRQLPPQRAVPRQRRRVRPAPGSRPARNVRAAPAPRSASGRTSGRAGRDVHEMRNATRPDGRANRRETRRRSAAGVPQAPAPGPPPPLPPPAAPARFALKRASSR